MSFELWSVIFSAATFVVIAATAIAAVVQLRHLRASNQLNALIATMQLWQSPEMQSWYRSLDDLPEKLKDPSYLEALRAHAESRELHPELMVADFWEQLGAYAKHGLVEERSWLDIAGGQVLRAWNSLEPVTMAVRERAGPSAWENFEYIAVRARLWQERYPDGTWPKSVPRMADLKKSKS